MHNSSRNFGRLISSCNYLIIVTVYMQSPHYMYCVCIKMTMSVSVMYSAG